jgi:hypothetical protein
VPSRPAAIPQILTQLAETPRSMAALTAGLSPESLRTAPDNDEWSASQVPAPLGERACGEAASPAVELQGQLLD